MKPTKKAILPTKDPLEKILENLTPDQLNEIGRVAIHLRDKFARPGFEGTITEKAFAIRQVKEVLTNCGLLNL